MSCTEQAGRDTAAEHLWQPKVLRCRSLQCTTVRTQGLSKTTDLQVLGAEMLLFGGVTAGEAP